MRTFNLTLIVMTLAVASAFAGCGGVDAPEADEQDVTTLDVPQAPARPDQPFSLHQDDESVTYGGSLLMWDDAVTKTQIAAVAKASVDSRLQKAGNLRFRQDELLTLKASEQGLRDLRRALSIKIEQAKADGTRIADVLRPAVAKWFETRLTGLEDQGKLSAADVAHARAHFEAYCEYKVWELATNPLLKNEFEARPTPLQMCEPYYKRAGLLKTNTAVCKERDDRRDFFGCLWEQGVMQTKLFKGKLDNASCDVEGLTRAAAITSWVASADFRAALFDSELADGIQTYGELLNAAILSRGTIPSELRAKYPFFADCKKAFKNDLAAPAEPNWEYASLLDLKSIVEGPGDGTELYTLLPKTGDAMLDHERHALLAKPATIFGQRTVTDAAVNDRLFNQNAQGTVRPGDYFYKLYLTAPEFAGVRAEEDKAVPADLRAAAASLDADLARAATRLKEAQAAMQARVRELTVKTYAGVKAVMDPGATTLFMPLVMKVTRTSTGLDVVLTLNDPGAAGIHSIVGCAAYISSTGCIPAAATTGVVLQKSFDATAYDLSSGKLTLDVKLDDLAALGLQVRERSPASPTFNALSQDVLSGRVLRFEAYANQVNESLRIVTGKAVLIDALDRDGAILQEGSFSADDYATQINE